MISSAVMPAARQSKITLTGTRVPVITAWPCITLGSVEIIAICSLVTVPVCRVEAANANPLPVRRCSVSVGASLDPHATYIVAAYVAGAAW